MRLQMKIYLVLFVGVIIGGIYGISMRLPNVVVATDRIPEMEDGQYTGYHLQKMFDGKSGAPVYWIVAGKGTNMLVESVPAYIEPRERNIKLYSIRRDRVLGLAESEVNGCANPFTYHFTVRDGEATFLSH